MTLNGKRDGFTLADFEACAKATLMKRGRAKTIVNEVQAAVKRWPEFAQEAVVAAGWRESVRAAHRMGILS
jgi:serine/threonine-protein kinase HipA